VAAELAWPLRAPVEQLGMKTLAFEPAVVQVVVSQPSAEGEATGVRDRPGPLTMVADSRWWWLVVVGSAPHLRSGWGGSRM